MDYAFRVRGGKGVSDLDAKIEKKAEVDWRAVDAMFQSLPFQQLHGDERLIVCFADVVYGADVRVVQGGSGAGFALKTIERETVTGHFGRKKLQRDVAAETSVFGLVNHAHTATTQFFNDAIVRDGLSKHGLSARRRVILEARWVEVKSDRRASGLFAQRPFRGNAGIPHTCP